MSEHSFDPEVVALLEEVARSSSSTLLRTPKERLLRWVGRPEDVISPHGSYLSKAEKHLVTAYREQAASVLHAACIERLASLQEFGVFVESWRRPDMREVDRRAFKLGPKMSPGHANGGIQGLLLNHATVSACQLAAAALRLVPADQTRITLGNCYHVDGLPLAAMRVFESVLSGAPTSVMRAIAHDNCGGVQCALVNHSQALECYVDASRASEGRWKTAVFRMVTELQLGMRGDARQSAKALASLKVKPDWFAELVDFYKRSRSAKSGSLTAKARQAITELHDSMPEEARRVCDALYPIHA